MWFLSGVWNPCPETVRRTKAQTASISGTPRMKTGINSGAKKKNVTPLAGGAHEELRGMEVVAQEPQTDAAGQRRDQWPDVVAREQSEGLEAQSVETERARGNRDDAAGQPVEAVDEIDRVRKCEDPHRGDDRQNRGTEHDKAGEGQLELIHRGATEVQDRRREELTGDLGRRAHLTEVVEHPDDEDDARREQHAEHLVRGEDDRAQRRDRHGD